MIDSGTSSRPSLVLVANDQEWSARSLESVLGPNGYAVLRAYTGRQALDLARSVQPDAIILDLRMPDISGIDVCRQLIENPRIGAATPIIITTDGSCGRSLRLEAHAAGAWEVYQQPLDGEILLHKLANFVRAKRELDRGRDETLLDATTGLYNSRGLARRAREIGAEAHRRQDPLACVAFAPEATVGNYSDELVEQVAARVVTHLAEICRRTGRTSDAIGRLGQAEFAIIAPATGARGAVQLAQRLRQTVEAQPIDFGGVPHQVRIRAGYSAVSNFAESPGDAVELLLRATTALRRGRDSNEHPEITGFEETPVIPAP